MKILTSLTYYFPYVSGVTIYAQRLAEALAEHGHQVTVLTSHHQKSLKKQIVINQVEINRVPVLFKIGKGVFMPNWLFKGAQLISENEVVLFHLPQVEAAPLAIFARILGKRVIATYHCDVVLPPGFFNRLQQGAVFMSNYLTCLFCHRIVSYTRDYGLSSPLLGFFEKKLVFILPPVKVEKPSKKEKNLVDRKIGQKPGEVLLGFAGRVAAEKGIEYLLETIPLLLHRKFQPKIVIAGPEEEVVGEIDYVQKMRRLAAKYKQRIIYLGSLNQKQMVAFYQAIDILLLPSLNRTESFGLVQVEAMLFGKPVIASNLYGVRIPIKLTGMGEIILRADSRALANAIEKILKDRQDYLQNKSKIKNIFSIQKTIASYERIFSGR